MTLLKKSIRDPRLVVDINIVQSKVHFFYSNLWSSEVFYIPLRAYIPFKTVFDKENYIILDMPKHLQSILTLLECEIIPLRIETGRPVAENLYFFLLKSVSIIVYWLQKKPSGNTGK